VGLQTVSDIAVVPAVVDHLDQHAVADGPKRPSPSGATRRCRPSLGALELRIVGVGKGETLGVAGPDMHVRVDERGPVGSPVRRPRPTSYRHRQPSRRYWPGMLGGRTGLRRQPSRAASEAVLRDLISFLPLVRCQCGRRDDSAEPRRGALKSETCSPDVLAKPGSHLEELFLLQCSERTADGFRVAAGSDTAMVCPSGQRPTAKKKLSK